MTHEDILPSHERVPMKKMKYSVVLCARAYVSKRCRTWKMLSRDRTQPSARKRSGRRSRSTTAPRPACSKPHCANASTNQTMNHQQMQATSQPIKNKHKPPKKTHPQHQSSTAQTQQTTFSNQLFNYTVSTATRNKQTNKPPTNQPTPPDKRQHQAVQSHISHVLRGTMYLWRVASFMRD